MPKRCAVRPAAGPLNPSRRTSSGGTSSPGREWWESSGRRITVLAVARLFFPEDQRLDLRSESCCPWILERVEWAGANLESFEKASEGVKKFLDLSISAKEIEKLTEKFGRERASKRDADIARFKERKLASQYREPPPVAVVSMDGGRAQTRAADSPPGVHEPRWVEFKAAHLSTYTNVSFRKDPQPEPPSKFLDPPQVVRLVNELRGDLPKRADREMEKTPRQSNSRGHPRKALPRPEPKVRTVVATTKAAEEFGEMTATEAQRRGFYDGRKVKRAVLGDGSIWIWNLAAFHFPFFIMILDFLHLLGHLYGAAHAAFPKHAKKAWRFYTRLLRMAWEGRTSELKTALKQQAERVGKPPGNAREDDPRKILWNVVEYVQKNSDKMDYPCYRKEGLPISSAPVESLVKQINRRVKGTEKFWVPRGLEAILQVRAAHLSDDGRVEEYWRHRPPDRAYGRNRFKPAA